MFQLQVILFKRVKQRRDLRTVVESVGLGRVSVVLLPAPSALSMMRARHVLEHVAFFEAHTALDREAVSRRHACAFAQGFAAKQSGAL